MAHYSASPEMRTLSLTGATVAYAPSAAGTKSYVRVIESVAAALGGKAVPLTEATEYTVLIAPTEQTDALLEGKENAYAVCCGEDRVTLWGTDALTTLMAVKDLRSAAEHDTHPAHILAEGFPTVTLADREKCYATFVYGAQLYDKPYHPSPELV